MKINILETTTEKGDITIARERYLKVQIKALDVQFDELMESENLNKITRFTLPSLLSTIGITIDELNDELSDYYDTSEEYNS